MGRNLPGDSNPSCSTASRQSVAAASRCGIVFLSVFLSLLGLRVVGEVANTHKPESGLADTVVCACVPEARAGVLR